MNTPKGRFETLQECLDIVSGCKSLHEAIDELNRILAEEYRKSFTKAEGR